MTSLAEPSVIEAPAEKWRQCAGKPESTLLRLAILRELTRLFHAQKSSYLAGGRRDLLLNLRGLEERLLDLRQATQLEGDLPELLKMPARPTKKTRHLPEALYTVIDRTKLERYDRQWEAALAAEAYRLGWGFWVLEAWVEIAQVESWNEKLNANLWPAGLTLFVESSPASNLENSGNSSPAQPPQWQGRWISVVHGELAHPAILTADLAQWPGSPSAPPSRAQWTPLFSPPALPK